SRFVCLEDLSCPYRIHRPTCACNSKVANAPFSSQEKGANRVEPHYGEFGPEFSELTRRAARQPWTTIARGTDYLDWRYRRHYHLEIRLLQPATTAYASVDPAAPCWHAAGRKPPPHARHGGT